MKTSFLVAFVCLFFSFVIQEEDSEYNFKIYTKKENIDVQKLIFSDIFSEKEAKLAQPKLFLYQDSAEKIRIAIYKNKVWHTWEIYDANGQVYFAKLTQKQFNGVGNFEILIQSKYGLDLQSTFGSSYDGSFQIWNIDEPMLYFEIQNYEYFDDLGRNGEGTQKVSCFLTIEVVEKKIKVLAKPKLNKDCFLSQISDELIGEYVLENGEVVKK